MIPSLPLRITIFPSILLPVFLQAHCSSTENYTTMEKGLLSIVETFKEFHTMLFGCHELHVYTDHCNLTFHMLTYQPVMHWHLYLEEYQPHFHYIKGSSNTLTDALSRLPTREGQTMDSIFDPSPCSLQERMSSFNYDKDNLYDHTFTALVNNDKLLQCMLNYPEIEMEEPFLLDYGYLSAAQSRDPQLIQKIEQDSEHYNWLLVAPQLRLVAHRKEPGDNPKICIPDELLDKFIQFYHLALAHAGMNKVHQTMTTHFWSPNIIDKSNSIFILVRSVKRTNCQEKAMAT